MIWLICRYFIRQKADLDYYLDAYTKIPPGYEQKNKDYWAYTQELKGEGEGDALK
jgi:hypothetical protein